MKTNTQNLINLLIQIKDIHSTTRKPLIEFMDSLPADTDFLSVIDSLILPINDQKIKFDFNWWKELQLSVLESKHFSRDMILEKCKEYLLNSAGLGAWTEVAVASFNNPKLEKDDVIELIEETLYKGDTQRIITLSSTYLEDYLSSIGPDEVLSTCSKINHEYLWKWGCKRLHEIIKKEKDGDQVFYLIFFYTKK